MKIYHGSKITLEQPIPNGSPSFNDYGPAFYTTMDLESAHEWACRNSSVGVVNEYDFDISKLKVLDLSDSNKWSVLNWLAILMHFRSLDKGFTKAFGNRLAFLEEKYYIDITKYDAIIGFRADDAYFRFPLDFIRGNLTIAQLEESFKLGKLGIQVVLISEEAFKYLKFVRSIPSEDKYINRYYENVKVATKRFDSLSKDEEGIRIYNIMEKNK